MTKIEKSQFQEQSSASTSAKVPQKVRHAEHGMLSVAEVAKCLSVNASTVTRWCESGKLVAMPKPYGKKTTWQISHQAVEMLRLQLAVKQEEKAKPKAPGKTHGELLPQWKRAMGKGTLNGKVFSPATITDYLYYAGLYFARHKSVSVDALKAELMRIPSAQFSKREHYYKAILCLGKFLIQEGCLEKTFVEDSKTLKPKRHLPPKRHTVNREAIASLMDACESPQDRLIITLLSQTGLRASEACALKWEDIDTEQGVLIVRLGKGNKTRRVGLSSVTVAALQKHMEACQNIKPHRFVFLDKLGKPMLRGGLYQRVERIGKKAGVPVSPHALRRAFVTINASKGRPLPMLQRACGHEDLKTTMSYCQIAEQEVIEAMKGWE